MAEQCNLCESGELENIYTAPGSLRDLKVFICEKCGLLQSLPRVDHVKDRTVRVTSGAAWGNVRYGKAFAAKFALDFLQLVLPNFAPAKVLDVGSNRGAFLKRLMREFPEVEVLVGVEPDSSVINSYQDDAKVILRNDRIENLCFDGMQFDFIYCSHSIEHFKDPVSVLKKLRGLAESNNTVYFFEVPNAEILSSTNLLEEFFIDKHLYHYDERSFRDLLEISGYQILKDGFFSDSENLRAVCRPVDSLPVKAFRSQSEIRGVKSKVYAYAETLQKNRDFLVLTGKALNSLANEKNVVFWGGGRIFDAFVTIGGLDTAKLYMLVDRYLSELSFSAHGLVIESPEAIRGSVDEIDLIIVASRAYKAEIEAEASEYGFFGPVIGFDDLIREGFDGYKI